MVSGVDEIDQLNLTFPSALQKEQWAASSPLVVKHTHVLYHKNVNENFIFNWSVRGTANLLATIFPSKSNFDGNNG